MEVAEHVFLLAHVVNLNLVDHVLLLLGRDDDGGSVQRGRYGPVATAIGFRSSWIKGEQKKTIKLLRTLRMDTV